MLYWLHLLNSPLCELTSIISILWWIYLFFKKISIRIQFLSVTALKKEQAGHKQSSWQMPLRIMLLFLSHSLGFFGISLSFCPGDLDWFSASGFLSCHLREEGIRKLPLSWNWSQNHRSYCLTLSFCSLGWVTSNLSIVNF